MNDRTIPQHIIRAVEAKYGIEMVLESDDDPYAYEGYDEGRELLVSLDRWDGNLVFTLELIDRDDVEVDWVVENDDDMLVAIDGPPTTSDNGWSEELHRSLRCGHEG